MMLSVLLILNPLSTLLSLLIYVFIKYPYLLYVYIICTSDLNNYVILVRHVPIYWSERIDKVGRGMYISQPLP